SDDDVDRAFEQRVLSRAPDRRSRLVDHTFGASAFARVLARVQLDFEERDPRRCLELVVMKLLGEVGGLREVGTRGGEVAGDLRGDPGRALDLGGERVPADPARVAEQTVELLR